MALIAMALRIPEAELVQAAQQEADDQDLFHQAVLQGRQDQHRDAPPDVGQALRDHVEVEAQVEGGYDPAEPEAADDRGHDRAAQQVLHRALAVQADDRRGLALAGDQVQRQHHRGHAEQGVGQLEEQVEGGAAGSE